MCKEGWEGLEMDGEVWKGVGIHGNRGEGIRMDRNK